MTIVDQRKKRGETVRKNQRIRLNEAYGRGEGGGGRIGGFDFIKDKRGEGKLMMR